MEFRYCKKCFMPSTRPRVSFSPNGLCNACDYKEIPIDYESRRQELEKILSGVRNKHSEYDCVVAWSGGKDSSSIALRLREEFGVNALLVTFSPLLPTPEGDYNKRAVNEVGFDSIEITPNQNVSRHLSRRFFIERGDPKLHWNAGINSAPIRVAEYFKIPIVFYAEHGESEYGGKVLSENSRRERDIQEILENQIGDDPINWVDERVSSKDLHNYQFPRDLGSNQNLRALYFGYFSHWDVNENISYVNRFFEFQTNSRGRTYGTFTDYDSVDDYMDDLYYYMQYIKFGFGRCLRDVSRQIHHERISREDGLKLITAYDGEFPEETIGLCLEYLKISRKEFEEIVDKHRPPYIWQKISNQWVHKYSLKSLL
jgi:N-acetyl sugar amidotransferase